MEKKEETLKAEVFIDPANRAIRSSVYNMLFKGLRKEGGQWIEDGTLIRWGAKPEDDPPFCPFGPEIADIEVSAGKCSGVGVGGCSYCYKSNSPDKLAQNMSLATYKNVLDKLAKSPALGQVALGLTGVKDNPDLINIMRYTRDKGIFPNFTLTGADLDLEMAQDMGDLCGALAVSCSPTNPNLCFDTVELFTSLGVQQTNIHVVVSEETMEFVNFVLESQKRDPRLKRMNAVVCLMVKPKGRAKGRFHPPTEESYQKMIHKCLTEGLRIGFDSCSANRFARAVNTGEFSEKRKERLIQDSDPCESLCFSIYVNVKGRVFPCSFGEPCEGWGEGLDLLAADDFIKDIWYHPLAHEWRVKLLELGRDCPLFPEIR